MPPPRKRGMTASAFRKILKDAGKSQIQAAKDLGVSLRTVHGWATGERRISVPSATLVRATFPTN